MSRMETISHEFLGFVVEDTPKAVLFWCHYWEAPDWFPRSQITMLNTFDSIEVKILASPWICKAKNVKEATCLTE